MIPISSVFFQSQPFLCMLARILLATLSGAAIGYERTRLFKNAGIRTLCIVACATSLLTILSKYGFSDLVTAEGTFLFGSKGADPSRLAAQIVSGIGFLGAGVIFKTGSSVKGLTSAAYIFVAAAVGMAIGAGAWALGIFVTVISTFVSFLLHRFTTGFDSALFRKIIFEVDEGDTTTAAALYEKLRKQHIAIVGENVSRENGRIRIEAEIRMSESDETMFAQTFLRENPEIRSIRM